jgi:hypothetical protein
LSKTSKKNPIDRLADKLLSFEANHPEIVNPDGKVMQETEAQIQARFAKLREARAKKTNKFGDKTYEDVWDNITKEEEDYYRQKRREYDPAQRYQDEKEEPLFHDSSWDVRGLDGYDGQGCNQFTGCVPGCRYYEPTGRVEFEEIEARIEEYKRKKKQEQQQEQQDNKEEDSGS